jgi:acyl transferase domain-containing protein
MSSADKFNYDIAVIGMAGRFPGARNLDEFWQNLLRGVESVTFFSDEELLRAGVEPALLDEADYVKAGAVIEDAELFDASFFNLTPREAEMMDPQHRLFLEHAWQALEVAGYESEKYAGRIGVFAGESVNTYLLSNLLPRRELIESVGVFQTLIGNDRDHLTTQTAYKLNLKGPCVNVQTACSTSLVAVHLACQSLLNRECEVALAGGVSVGVPQAQGSVYQEGGIVSPDGHCRAFDARAGGTVKGSGVGVVVLKRLADALADGDCIEALIKGSAINNDGSLKVGYTAPSVEGQAGVIEEALAVAMVEPLTISYVETHGTGTALGDPIEIAALAQAFGTAATSDDGDETGNFCAIGSLKTNIGHLDAAAGVASLIKTVLALKHGQIPQSLHFEQPNPNIDFARTPFYVNTRLSAWEPAAGAPRRAGVSSFGIGGTNAHIILEEAPALEASGVSRTQQLLTLSAKTATALDSMTANLAAYLKERPAATLADVAYTLQLGRKDFKHRRTLVCADVGDALSALESMDPGRVYTNVQERESGAVVFMFPGQGSQFVNMARELYESERTFRLEVDRCAELLKEQQSPDLRSVLYAEADSIEESAGRLKQTFITQPALFVIEYALAKLWMEWGVRPRAMIGHSIGEYVAACLAGVFSLEDALSLVALRGKLVQSLPEGAMLGVRLAEDELRRMLCEKLSIAAINGPSLCTVSGPVEAIDELQGRLAESGADCQRLMTSHAFHSQMMAPIIAEFNEQVRRVKLNAPKIRYVSNVSGTWIKASEATDPAYWARHLRQTVRFADGARELLKDTNLILLEVGPGQSLSAMVRPLARETVESPVVINSLRHPHERVSDEELLMKSLGRLWLAGARIDWTGFYADETRRRMPLPTYPFERRRYWVGWQKPATGQAAPDDALSKRPDVADWFYLPFWKPSVPPFVPDANAAAAARSSLWLIFEDEGGFGAQVAEQLKERGGEVLTVTSGERFERLDNQGYTINIAQPEDYEALMLDLKSHGQTPVAAVHCLSIRAKGQDQPGTEDAERTLQAGFYSLVFLARSLGQNYLSEKITIAVLTDSMQRVTGEERIVPEKATILGPCKVIPKEYPNIACRSIDVSLAGMKSGEEARLLEQVVRELVSDAGDALVAYRANQRWVEAFEPVRLEATSGAQTRLRQEGVYLITGGLGGIGMEMAEHLAQTLRARLALIGRSEFPAKDEWLRWLDAHPNDDEVSVKIRRLREMENLGAEVLVISADVSDEVRMREALRLTRESFGQINGVIHAAGISPGGMIEGKTPLMMKSVLAPKVKGTRVLEALLKDEGLDFLALFSSLESILGTLGQVDYCAANAFLDAFAHYYMRENGVPTLAINWDAWRDVGMSAKARGHFRLNAAGGSSKADEGDEENSLSGEQGQGFLQTAISSQEGVDAFRRLLAHNVLPRALVSTKDLPSVIREAEAFTHAHILEEIEQFQRARATHPRPFMETAYVAPRNELEEHLAGAVQSVLGIERVGVHDNFFDLGGHSLLATQLASRLRELFQMEIALRIIFERPTAAGLAEYIEQTGKSAATRAVPTLEIVPVPRQARSVKRPRKTETN